VICDASQTVFFSADGSNLKLTGIPVWYCWKYTTDDSGERQSLQDSANTEANNALQAEFERDQHVLPAADFNRKYSHEYQKRRFDQLWDSAASRLLLKAMPAYSTDLSNAIAGHNGVNPSVYQALVLTMRYMAFFRNVKANQPAVFNAFAASLQNVAPDPAVTTPTVLIGHGE
jgi:hypothetical protein